MSDESVAEGPARPETPSYRLHSAENVAIATFIGLPIGGAWLMASNDLKLGNSSRARTTLVVGLLATVALFVLIAAVADHLPPGFPAPLLWAAYTGAMRAWARQAQGEAYASHLAAAGPKASSWAALGIGVMSAVLFGVAAVVMLGIAAVLLGKT